VEARRAEREFDCLSGHLQLVSSRDGSVDGATWQSGADASWAQKTADGFHLALLLILLALLVGTVVSPTLKRQVVGAVPSLLGEAGIDFTDFLSLWDLPGLTASRGGLNYILAATFIVFIILAPMVRVISFIALITIPFEIGTARKLYGWSRRVVGFTAIEVMIIATPLIGQSFGPISQALLTPHNFPPCKTLVKVYDIKNPNECLSVDVVPQLGYWFNVSAVVMMCICGFDGSFTSKYIHRRLYPHDQHPPPNCKQCCD